MDAAQRFPADLTLPVPGDDGLVLRPFIAADTDDLTTACNDPEVTRWLPLARPHLREHAQDFITRVVPGIAESGTGIQLAIELAGRLVGAIDLRRAHWRAMTVEVGYWVAPWGRGHRIAARSTRVLVDHALARGFQRVEARVHPENAASLRTCELAGLQPEGVLRRAGFINDPDGPGLVQCDLVVLSRVAEGTLSREA